jgi:hypothetical protein
MASYESYNWDADEKWKEYLQNVTVPTSGTEQMMERLKKRYFKRNINPDFDENMSQPQPPPPSSYSPPPQRTQSQPQPQARQNQPPPQPQPQPNTQQPSFISLDKVLTISHVYLLVNAVLFAIPGTSSEFSYSCYRRALFSGCVAYGAYLYQTFASGPYRGNARVKDFVYYLLYCAAVLNTTSPSLIYLFPLAICSFFMVGETIVQYTARLPILSILGRLLQKLLAYQQQAQFTVAYTELIAFVMSICQLVVGSTSLITVLTLWTFVIYRYQTAQHARHMVDTYTQRVSIVFQHRLVPAMVKSFYAKTSAFVSNYAQYTRQ